MSKDYRDFESEVYEKKYREGYGHVYPESHVIRAYKRAIEPVLGTMTSPKVFDFGCGTGANLVYFANNGFRPFGCDVSPTAIEKGQNLMPGYAENLRVSETVPDLIELFDERDFDLFYSNQVFYYLEDATIRSITRQAYDMLREGGVFMVSMMARSHWFYGMRKGRKGDFEEVDLMGTRLNQQSLLNFKDQAELPELFKPFETLMIGFYTLDLLPDEGPNDHWLYLGVKK